MSGFQVAAERCDQCLFSKDRIVSQSRMRQVLADCARRDTHFVCHKFTLDGGRDVCCRAFYETRTTNLIRIAQRLGLVRFVEIPSSLPGSRETTT